MAENTEGDKGCLNEWCRSPVACSGWGYCREWNFIDQRHLSPAAPSDISKKEERR